MKSNAETALEQATLKKMGGFPIKFVEMSDALGRYDKIAAAAGHLASRLPPAQFPRMLDICCGTGHWAAAMAGLGYRVTGIDSSEEQIEAARARCGEARFVVGDMAEPPAGPFDLVLNTYSSFGYGLTKDEDLRMLRAWWSVLRYGGCMILEMADIERARHVFGTSDRVVRGDGVKMPKEDLRMDWEQQMLFVDYTMGEWQWGGFTRFYSADELAGMLETAGFNRVSVAGDFSGMQPKRPEDWMVLTCWK